MKSFKQMVKDGEVTRADAMKMPHALIHHEPGFNLRDTSTPKFRAGIDALKTFLRNGGQVPALEVRPREEGGAWLVDGHRRHLAYGELIAEGVPIGAIPVVAFSGNDVKRTARILTSQDNEKLDPLEIAAGYRRLVAFGLTPDEIAAEVSKTRQHVDQMLILANSNRDVQVAVAAGDISPTEAIKLQRQHGDDTGSVIQKAKDAAQGKKITAKAIKPWTPPAKVVTPTLNALESFLESVPKDQRLVIEQGKDAEVVVNAQELRDLFEAFGGIKEAKAAAVEKERGKLAKAAQGQIAGTDGA